MRKLVWKRLTTKFKVHIWKSQGGLPAQEKNAQQRGWSHFLTPSLYTQNVPPKSVSNCQSDTISLFLIMVTVWEIHKLKYNLHVVSTCIIYLTAVSLSLSLPSLLPSILWKTYLWSFICIFKKLFSECQSGFRPHTLLLLHFFMQLMIGAPISMKD